MTAIDLNKCTLIAARDRPEIERKIDVFLRQGRPHVDRPLILPAAGSASRFAYRGITVRRWSVTEETPFGRKVFVRYDACVELT